MKWISWIGVMLGFSLPAGAQRLIVANMESHAPVRDIKIYTDDQQETRSAWDGSFTLHDGYSRITFVHPNFLKRYVLKSELKKDTIYLIPNTNTLQEVVIYGHRRFDNRMSEMMKPSPQQIERDKLPKVVPQGISPVALVGFLYDVTFRKSVEERARRKWALKEVRRQEEALQEKWDSLGLAK